MSKEKSTSDVGILGFVFLIFLVLKLAGIGIIANWSWWWVTSPIWIPIVVIFVISLFIVIAKIIKLLKK